MKEIEEQDFKVNDRVIVKRLNRKGYKRINGLFTKVEADKPSTNNKSITKVEKAVKSVTEPQTKVIQEYNNNVNNEQLKELIDLIEPIKEMLAAHERNKNIIDVKPIELKPKAVIEVKQKLFKIDTEVLKQWDLFIADHKEYKVQQLISLALEEFIDKYK